MSSAKPVAGVILAAGKGTRMKSDLPKVLHGVCGLPMVEHVGRAMRAAGVRRPIIVIGHRGDLIRAKLGDSHYAYVLQAEQLGTGHATLVAADALASHDGPVLVTPGDTPLLTAEALGALVDRHMESQAKATVATFVLDDPTGYGRVVRGQDGRISSIVEHRDADDQVRRIQEVNAGIYCFDARSLFALLPKLHNANAQGEYYVTDAVAALHAEGGAIESVVFDDPSILAGVNDRWQLAEAAQGLRTRILRQHALNGVTIVDPSSTYIGADVQIDPDCQIEPMTTLDGSTRIAAGSVIGPNSRVTDSIIGEGCVVLMSHLNGATLSEGSRCGPFANLRPGAFLGERVKVGNFVEVKNARIGEASSVSHLTYIGDAEIGASVNIGAGTITCNYDGFEKHKTTIEDGAFVGSNSTLVAPVRIGRGAIVGAGSVITIDVPADALALGRTRQENKEEWAKSWRLKKRQGCN